MKTLPRIAMTALASTCATAALAQSSLTIYGTLDLSADAVHKSQGNVQGTAFGLSGSTPVPNSIAAPKQNTNRLSNSLTAQSHFGLKGVEDLGGGWQGKFQLESSIVPDTGSIGTDGRFFGRQAWVGLTTPAGEFRLGRQGAPMLGAYYLNSVERLGSTDLLAAGVTVNNLQVFQDNMVSYLMRSGPWVGQLSFSPNAGVATRVSAARSAATSSTPVATTTTGQIVGGASAGAESDTGRGRSTGGFLAYNASELTWVASFHRNNFDVPVGLATAAGGFVPLFNLKDYQSWMTGVKYRIESTGTQLVFNYHSGVLKDQSGTDPKVNTLAFAVRQSVGKFDLTAQIVDQRFANFTKGSDRAVMFGAEYNLSKRTALYARVGQIKDDRGNVVRSAVSPIGLAGGPAVLLVPLGSLEVPYFSGAGASMDATTRLVGIGLRHSF